VISSAKSSPNKAFSRPRAGAIALVALIVVGSSGCGRRGALEPPPDPSAAAKHDDSGQPQIRHKSPAITPPKDPFILDPLL
jgi:predicted small lipoprotein YifL